MKRLRLSARSCCSGERSKFIASPPSQPERRLGDDVPLDLVGAGVDRGLPHIAVARGEARGEVIEVHVVDRAERLGEGPRCLHHPVSYTHLTLPTSDLV